MHQNLTKNESQALKWLFENNKIIVNPANKGGAVVVWGKHQ